MAAPGGTACSPGPRRRRLPGVPALLALLGVLTSCESPWKAATPAGHRRTDPVPEAEMPTFNAASSQLLATLDQFKTRVNLALGQ